MKSNNIISKNESLDKIIKAMKIDPTSIEIFRGNIKIFYNHLYAHISKAEHDNVIKILQDYGKQTANTIDADIGELVGLNAILGFDIKDVKTLNTIKTTTIEKMTKDFGLFFGRSFDASPHLYTKESLLQEIHSEIDMGHIMKSAKDSENTESFISLKVLEDAAKYLGVDLDAAIKIASDHPDDLNAFLAANPNIDISHH